MGYRVDYGGGPEGKKERRGIFRPLVMTFVCLAAFLFLVNAFWPEGAQILRTYLLPGDAAVTAAALEAFAQELRNGEEIASALENFCQKVMAYGLSGSG